MVHIYSYMYMTFDLTLIGANHVQTIFKVTVHFKDMLTL